MDIDIFLHALMAYFVVIDPLGVSLIFNALVKGHDPKHWHHVAFSAVALSLLVIMGFGFFGAKLLAQLGITLHAFRIAGGLLLVPLESFFQVRAKPEEKGAVIAAANFAGFLAMGLAGVASILLSMLPIGSLHLAILGAFCLPVAAWLAWEFRKNGGLK